LPSTLSLSPLQRLDLGQLLSFTDEFIHGNESGGLDAGDLEEENPVAGNASTVGSLEGGLEEGHASEERDGTGGLELVLELLGGVGGAGGGDDAGQAVDGMREGDIINLNKTRGSGFRECPQGVQNSERGWMAYSVDGEHCHNLLPGGRVVVGGELKPLADCAGEEVGTFLGLLSGVSLAGDTAGIRVPGLANRLAVVGLIVHELLDGNGIGDR